jgi:hypothetical protein
MVRRPGYLPTPGLLRRIRTLGGRARRQRLKRAFPGLAAGGEAVRSGGRVSISDHRHRDNGLRSPAPAGFVRAARRRWASDIATRALAIAAIGPPPSSRANHPASRGPARATDRADARSASSPAAARPASFGGPLPPRGRSVPRWVPASSPPRERSLFAVPNRRECCRRPAFATASARLAEESEGLAVRKSWHRSRSVIRGDEHPAPASDAPSPSPHAQESPRRRRAEMLV